MSTGLPRDRYHRLSRRDWLRIGSLTPFGLGMSMWPSVRDARAGEPVGSAQRCILLWLDGGPSHLETFDLKPHAPAEVRGPFTPIRTHTVGIEICEHLPLTAQVCDRLAIVRSLTSPLGEHGLAHHYLLTGYPPTPVVRYPSYGAVVSHLRPQADALPAYVAIPEARGAGAGFLAASCSPFETGGDPAHAEFQVRDLDLFPEVDSTRLDRRMDYLRAFDRSQAAWESNPSALSAPLQQAYRLATSADAKAAFALHREPASIRDRYGRRTFGQSCLLARRLVEHGVPFVTVTNTGWDTHEGLVLQLRDGYSGATTGVGLLPTFDQAFSALIEDLARRGLLDDTLVIAMGEFGRTPKLNPRGGRDHWPRVFSVVMAGGGVRGGQVLGSSDRTGESPSDSPVSPADLACTVYTLLGIDPHHELHSPDGRPIPVNQHGTFIRGLV